MMMIVTKVSGGSEERSQPRAALCLQEIAAGGKGVHDPVAGHLPLLHLQGLYGDDQDRRLFISAVFERPLSYGVKRGPCGQSFPE